MEISGIGDLTDRDFSGINSFDFAKISVMHNHTARNIAEICAFIRTCLQYSTRGLQNPETGKSNK